MRIEQSLWKDPGGWQQPSATELADGAQLVLVFGATELLDRKDVLDELRHIYPEAHYIGCSTAGEICGTRVHDGTLVATVHEASREMVDQAVLRGHEVSIGARSGAWGDMPMKQRLAIIHDFADRLMARVDDLVEAGLLAEGGAA